MGGCAALNCSNSDKKGYRMFKFPGLKDKERRKRWIINSRRDFEPTESTRLCEVHFEISQYEMNRADGWKKLKPNAVPTIFDVPNAPQRFDHTRKSLYKEVQQSSNVSQIRPECLNISSNISQIGPESPNISSDGSKCSRCDDLEAEIKLLQKKCKKMEEELQKTSNIINKLHLFLNEDQINSLEKPPRKWMPETIIKGLKLRISLGVHGYKYLHKTKYPIPAYSTLTERLREFQLNFGIFDNILETLAYKVAQLDENDRFCFLSIDEMAIDGTPSYDKNRGEVYGDITLPSSNQKTAASKLLVVLIRGVKTKWKQVIACHVTNGAIDGNALKNFIIECELFCRKAGLQLLAIGSDMGPENRKLWSQLGVNIQKNGMRKNFFSLNDRNIFIMPDACHLLKNLKSAILNKEIHLPKSYCELMDIPEAAVTASYIKKIFDIEKNEEIKSLHHLNREDLYPDNYEKMGVGGAIRFFSTKTVAAIRLAVNAGTLPADALTTAHFIDIIEAWFILASSRLRKTSLTKRNYNIRIDIFYYIIYLFETLEIDKGWKPLNTGMIMNSLSSIDIASTLFANNYDFIMFSRFTQDALENIFSYVRRRSGMMPNAKQCLESLKSLCVSQYISDISKTNCTADYDFYLLDFFKKPSAQEVTQPKLVSLSVVINENEEEYEFRTRPLQDINLLQSKKELLYNIAGSTTLSLLCQKSICKDCKEFLCNPMRENEELATYIKLLTKGGLKQASIETFWVILNCEFLFCELKSYFLHNSNKDILKYFSQKLEITFPECKYACNVKLKIIEHFFTVRLYAFCNKFTCNKRKKVHDTASAKKKKV